MNSPKHSLFTKTLLTLALVFGIAITWQALPRAPQKPEAPELEILHSESKPFSGLGALLEKFGITDTNIQDIVKATQKVWLRAAGKERWEVEDPHAHRKDELMPLFKEVGLVDEVKPEQKEFDYVLIMGALLARAQMRVDYAAQLWNEGYRFKEIVLLGSERKLDATQEPASAFGQEGKTPHTEFEMMQWVYDHANLPAQMREIKTSIINTPNTIDANGQVKRATTADTIRQWMQENPQPGSCLVISNQPHVGYQTAVVKSYLPEAFKAIPAGNALNPAARACEILDALARWIYQENELLKKAKK